QDLSAGDNHVCALTSGGILQCWGDNSKGALGEAPRTIHKTPILSQRIANATSIAAGQSHTCARTKTGRVLCWGDNKEGQLGEGETVYSMVPVAIAGF
ncbi:MAG TPA: RCC1 repeat-containing protein, partial [Nannocystis exedens]|nr:RCC1 repeat-containing protein [Nannocystis exedens]